MICFLLFQYARQYSSNEPMTFDWLCRSIGWPFSLPKTIIDLIHLEAVFDVLDLYLWFRYIWIYAINYYILITYILYFQLSFHWFISWYTFSTRHAKRIRFNNTRRNSRYDTITTEKWNFVSFCTSSGWRFYIEKSE